MESAGNSRTPFGAEMRKKHFSFAKGHRPLNHGSFGTYPNMVRDRQRQLQSEVEAAPDKFYRHTYLELLKQSRAAVAPLLGADPGEVVLVPNATTGVNTVLQSLSFQEGDTILYFSSIYGGCEKTVQCLAETRPISTHKIDITYPVSDDDIVAKFRSAMRDVETSGKQPKVAVFDTVLTSPGVRFPWEALVKICKALDILSLIDGAHGVGHLDLTHLSSVGPDFMVSNCYKWLMVPRGSAVLYVPFRNQKLISTTVPTSVGYETKGARENMDRHDYFSRLFERVSTVDVTPYCCIPAALKFRSEVCGGEAEIRKYCHGIARRGGAKMAEIMGTSILGDSETSFRRCCFVNVQLPLTPDELGDPNSGPRVAGWIVNLLPAEYGTYLPISFYAGKLWCRVSGQVYLDMDDFEWAAKTLLEVCKRAKRGEWK